MTIDDYKGKKVLILGLGVNQGGLGATKFFARAGAEVKVTDLKTEEELKDSLEELKEFSNIEYILGKHNYEDIDWADIVIRNPALKPDNPYRKYAENQGKVDTDVGIFIQFVNPKQIIGVTGTKGKSTTASLIYEILKGAQKNAVFAGNIGKSVLDTIPQVQEDTLVVLEISSFQLEGFDLHNTSPKWAVITNILPDHLNYYQSMDDYILAKKLIAKHQTEDDFLYIRKNDPVTDKLGFLINIKSQVIHFSAQDLPADFQPTLPGDHNKPNYAAALAVAKTLGIDQNQALEFANRFQGVEFRQQLIKTWNGIKIINDTASTSPSAAIAAVNTYPNCILITGGMNKNLPYDEMAYVIGEKAKSIYFLEGEASEDLKEAIKNKDKIKGTFNNFDDLLKAVKNEAKQGDVIILSPGAASFNLFQNEFDRGRKFNEALERIFD